MNAERDLRESELQNPASSEDEGETYFHMDKLKIAWKLK